MILLSLFFNQGIEITLRRLTTPTPHQPFDRTPHLSWVLTSKKHPGSIPISTRGFHVTLQHLSLWRGQIKGLDWVSTSHMKPVRHPAHLPATLWDFKDCRAEKFYISRSFIHHTQSKFRALLSSSSLSLSLSLSFLLGCQEKNQLFEVVSLWGF